VFDVHHQLPGFLSGFVRRLDPQITDGIEALSASEPVGQDEGSPPAGVNSKPITFDFVVPKDTAAITAPFITACLTERNV